MERSTRDAVPPLDRLARFLASGGWEHLDDDDATSLWVKALGEHRFQVVLPLTYDTSDSLILAREALDTLAFTLNRTRTDLIEDICNPVERVLVRLQPEAPTGQAPVTLLESAVRGLRDLVVGTASGLFTKSLVLPTRRPTLAEEFASSARVATGAGSFVVTMLLPLDLDEEATLEGFEEEPLGRRVTTLLTQFVTEAHALADHTSSDTPDLQAFATGENSRPNATVLGGLASIGGPDQLPYTLRIEPSATRPASFSPTVLEFTPERQAVLANASRYLRSREPARDTQVRGLVIRLTRDGASGPGDAVIEGVYDDSQSVGRVTVTLDQSDYEQAILAHRWGRHVTMTGDLKARGHRKYMDQVHGFDIVPEQST